MNKMLPQRESGVSEVTPDAITIDNSDGLDAGFAQAIAQAGQNETQVDCHPVHVQMGQKVLDAWGPVCRDFLQAKLEGASLENVGFDILTKGETVMVGPDIVIVSDNATIRIKAKCYIGEDCEMPEGMTHSQHIRIAEYGYEIQGGGEVDAQVNKSGVNLDIVMIGENGELKILKDGQEIFTVPGVSIGELDMESGAIGQIRSLLRQEVTENEGTSYVADEDRSFDSKGGGCESTSATAPFDAVAFVLVFMIANALKTLSSTRDNLRTIVSLIFNAVKKAKN